MNFLEAINSGKKIRSIHWPDNNHIDTKIFTDNIGDIEIYLIDKNISPLTWKEILSEWYFV